ncbi:MAG: AAA family ATPase, partial [Gemmatimonadetes bacterium]|nr:AAA family ATPase [Gemmatimonadota bacterium]
MRLETLGKPRLVLGDRAVGPEHEIVFALALLLLEAAPRRLSRTWVCELLWPDADRARASHNLRQALYKLRQLGGELDVAGEELALPPGTTWDVEERLRADAPQADPAQRWQFLAGYEPKLGPGFASRIEQWRERVHRRLVDRLLAGLRQARARTQWTRAVAYSHAILEVDPLNEEATLTLAEGRALQGSKAEAVALLDRYLAAIDGLPGELAIQPTLLKRRITQRLPAVLRDRPSWRLLVGRDDLLESFSAQMRRAREGTGTIVSMWGEPGVGKTRLVRELNALGAVEGWSVVTVSCEPTWPDRPLCALEALTSTLLLQPGALGVDPRAHRALMRLTKMDPDDEPLPQGAEDTAYRQRLLRSSVLDLIDAVSQERPLLVAVDDVQWLDPTSLPFYAMAVEHAATRRVAWVFASQQREELPKLATGTRALVSRVPALSEEESYQLLSELVRGQFPADHPAALRRAAIVSNGNPLYVHTLATHWLSTGDMSELPPSLEALIEQRLDTLDGRAMRCLQVCALLSRHGTVGRVETVLQEPRSVLMAALDQLHASGLVETQGDAPLVRHGIIATRAVGRASKATVVLLHGYIAAALEPVAREGHDAALLVACAEHLRKANQEQRGVELVETTTKQLLRAGSLDAAWEIVRALDEEAELGVERLKDLSERLSAEIIFSSSDRSAGITISDQILRRSKVVNNRNIAEFMLLWSQSAPDFGSPTGVGRAIALCESIDTKSPFAPRAFAQAIIQSDSSLAPAALARALAVVRKRTPYPAPETEDWLRLQMLCAFYKRDARLAVDLATRRVDLSDTSGSLYSKITALADLATAVRVLFPTRDPRGPARLAAEFARETANVELQIRMLIPSIHCHIDAGDLRHAAKEFERALALAIEHDASGFASSIAVAAVRLAISG